MLKWVRPSSVKFPITWASFKGKQTPDGQQREYIIQDITDDYKDEIIQHTFDYFVKDEPMCKYSGISEENAKQELSKFWIHAINQRLSIMCLTNDDKPKIVGVNYTAIASKDDTPYSTDNKGFDKFLKTLEFVSRRAKPFQKFGVNEYLSAYGLVVLSEYRGDRIGYNFLKVRKSFVWKSISNLAMDTATVTTRCDSAPDLAKNGPLGHFLRCLYDSEELRAVILYESSAFSAPSLSNMFAIIFYSTSS